MKIKIPDEVVEAAAREIAMSYGKDARWEMYKLDARASIAAGLNAWPGAWKELAFGCDGYVMCLPLPQETKDAASQVEETKDG